MRKFLNSVNRYASHCDWKQITLLKLCVFSAGALVGASLPERKRRPVIGASALAFAVTYVPLMRRFLPFLLEEPQDEEPLFR